MKSNMTGGLSRFDLACLLPLIEAELPMASAASTVNDNGRIFLGDGTILVQIAHDGQASPDGNGRYSLLDQMELNDLGQAAFFAAFRDTMGGSSDETGILRADTTSLVNIVRTGQMAPDGNGAFCELHTRRIFHSGDAEQFGASGVPRSPHRHHRRR